MKIGQWEITKKDLAWFIACLLIIISFIGGYCIVNKTGAADVISGASTVASIALSLVAMLHTMIESSNSTAVNQNTTAKLTEIDLKVNQAIEKIDNLKDVEQRIKLVLPTLLSQAKIIEEAQQSGNNIPPLSPVVAEHLQFLQSYLNEDIEE